MQSTFEPHNGYLMNVGGWVPSELTTTSAGNKHAAGAMPNYSMYGTGLVETRGAIRSDSLLSALGLAKRVPSVFLRKGPTSWSVPASTTHGHPHIKRNR